MSRKVIKGGPKKVVKKGGRRGGDPYPSHGAAGSTLDSQNVNSSSELMKNYANNDVYSFGWPYEGTKA